MPDTLLPDLPALGNDLARRLAEVLAHVVAPGDGPIAAARTLGLDKVLLSRVMKALRARDGAAALAAMPGPEPLRRLLASAAHRGAAPDRLAAAHAAVDRYDAAIRDTGGGRSLLDTILSAWDPGARRDFELRRKQAAFKAISQIRGAEARVNHAAVLLAPSSTLGMLDVLWVSGYLGLLRLRPGATVRFASRRLSPSDRERRPTSIDGAPLDSPESMLLADFCSAPLPSLDARRLGDSIFYTLAGDRFGGASAVNLVYAEMNAAELPRHVPAGSGRRRFFFAESAVPSAVLQFDILIHRDLNPAAPRLDVYDTSYEGTANPNDPARDLDRLDLLETIEPLASLRSPDVPRYEELLARAAAGPAVRADLAAFHAWRCRIDYPLYGSQVTASFPGEEAPA